MLIMITSVILLGLFALLSVGGITESTKVVVGVFLFHLTSLLVLSGFIIYFLEKYLSFSGSTTISVGICIKSTLRHLKILYLKCLYFVMRRSFLI